MAYTLKKSSPAFDMVDGPMAGRKFRHGAEYAEIPQAYADRFASVQDAAPPAQTEKPKKRRETVMPDDAEKQEE